MKKIGIIGAMELEVEELKRKMEVSRKVEKTSMEFLEGTLNGTPVAKRHWKSKCGALCADSLRYVSGEPYYQYGSGRFPEK